MSSDQVKQDQDTRPHRQETHQHTHKFGRVDVNPVQSQLPLGSPAIPHTRPLIEVPVLKFTTRK